MDSGAVTSLEVNAWTEHYANVRDFSEQLAAQLEPEDCVIQSMPDVSPTRWHLAHTTWFFETFLLAPACPNYQPVRAEYEYLFNSYYNQLGRPFPRSSRGLLSRPTVAEVLEYRREVDGRVQNLLAEGVDGRQLHVLELGLHHEQQHQELILTDIKHVFSCNPLLPAYQDSGLELCDRAPRMRWLPGVDGLVHVGHDRHGFCFDNELPRHQMWLEPHRISSRLVNCGEYLAFMEDGGYSRPELWLSLGWQHVQEHRWEAPLYWVSDRGSWREFTLHGLVDLQENCPVSHISYFEADAFARWSGARLPTEHEWEASARRVPADANFVESGRLHPRAPLDEDDEQWYGDVWEWTSSSYAPYPGYAPPPGAVGEYNGKFMCNQYVLRGGSCATSSSHIRRTYRNFFPPEARWQFTGIRLAS